MNKETVQAPPVPLSEPEDLSQLREDIKALIMDYFGFTACADFLPEQAFSTFTIDDLALLLFCEVRRRSIAGRKGSYRLSCEKFPEYTTERHAFYLKARLKEISQ